MTSFSLYMTKAFSLCMTKMVLAKYEIGWINAKYGAIVVTAQIETHEVRALRTPQMVRNPISGGHKVGQPSISIEMHL